MYSNSSVFSLLTLLLDDRMSDLGLTHKRRDPQGSNIQTLELNSPWIKTVPVMPSEIKNGITSIIYKGCFILPNTQQDIWSNC